MMRSNPDVDLVTVIVPVYNVRPFLREALDSVIHQTYPRLEIIVVDDGSEDGSGEICDAYAAADPRIAVIHQRNQGLSAARNAGLERMHGQALAFLDSDDAYCPAMIETMVNAMHREDADVVVCKHADLRTERRMVAPRAARKQPPLSPGLYPRVDAMRALADQRLDMSVWNKLYRAELWRDLRFPPGRVYEDVTVAWPLLGNSARICVLPDLLYLHRIRTGSITASDNMQFSKDELTAWLEYESFIQRNVPEIFSGDQLLKARQSRLRFLISYYCRYARGDMRREEKERIRQWVLSVGRDVPARKCSPIIRYSWHMLCHRPGLLRALYPIFKLFRNGIRLALNR